MMIFGGYENNAKNIQLNEVFLVSDREPLSAVYCIGAIECRLSRPAKFPVFIHSGHTLLLAR